MSESLKRILLIIVLILLIIIAIPLLVPLLASGVIASWVNSIQFKKRYSAFLKANNEMLFFCYSDRRNQHEWINLHILPHLDPALNVVFVEELIPNCEFDKRCVSHMLDNVVDKGCPNLMRITKGRVIDVSLQEDMQRVLDQDLDTAVFMQVIRDKVEILKQKNL